MRRIYKKLDINNRDELENIKVGDTFVYNEERFYPMKVMAITKDLIVGLNENRKVYTIVNKATKQVGPDSFWCLGYDDEEMAKKNIDNIQKWLDDAESNSLKHGEYGDVDRDYRGRKTINLVSLKVK